MPRGVRVLLHLISSVRDSVRSGNWYAALAGALALPDIAAKLDGRPGNSQRFVSWFDDYLLPKYTTSIPNLPVPHVFLSGEDCYALRCAFLHGGDFDITSERIRDVLNRFVFVAPPANRRAHRIQGDGGSTLLLQVNLFCEDVCVATEEWLKARGNDPNVAAAISRLPSILVLSQELGF